MIRSTFASMPIAKTRKLMAAFIVTLLLAISLGEALPASASGPSWIEHQVTQFTRDQTDGVLSWRISVSWSTENASCYSSTCRIRVMAELSNGDRVGLGSSDRQGQQHSGEIEIQGHYTLTNFALDSVWVETGNSSKKSVSSKSTVDDHVLDPSIGMTVQEFNVNDTLGSVNYSVRVNYSNARELGSCQSSNCRFRIQGKTTNGDWVQIGEVSRQTNWYNASSTLSSTFSSLGRVFIELRTATGSPSVYTEAVGISSSVSGGHDLDAAAEMLLAYVVGISSPSLQCTALFTVGTHSSGSSLSDQNLACQSAVTAGELTMKQIVVSILRDNGPAYVRQMLVLLGTADNTARSDANPELDYGPGPLPPGCYWGEPTSIHCDQGNQQVEVRPPSLAPPIDPLGEHNALEELRRNQNLSGQPELYLDNPADPLSAPIPGGDWYMLEAWRACVAKVSQLGGNGVVQTPYGPVGYDECTSKNLFVAGFSVQRATGAVSTATSDHDRDAISQFPAWIMLNRASVPKDRNDWTSTTPCNVGYPGATVHCDEYPYFSTDEGHPASMPSLRLVPSWDNTSQGSRLGWFYQTCPSFGYPGVGPDMSFLVVPIAALPTSHLCGNSGEG